jgi:hypothetical protein
MVRHRDRLLALALVGLAACGSGGGSAQGDDDGTINCATDPRAMTYTANMQQAGHMGALSFVLSSSDPAPPTKGNNTWNVKLLDHAGSPVMGATIDVVPFMPDHGHGTSVTPVVTPEADHYKIDPLYLFMHGLWNVTLTATSGAVTDTAVFTFCIQG